jgi:hypothetical protein
MGAVRTGESHFARFKSLLFVQDIHFWGFASGFTLKDLLLIIQP